ARGGEVALLVEDGRVREDVLAVHPVNLAVRADRGGVVGVAFEKRKAEHRHRPARAGGDLLQALRRLGDEGGPQEEIFGRIARDRELGERDEVAGVGVGPLVRLDDARRVALEVTDDEVQLREANPKARHASRIRACRSGCAERPKAPARSVGDTGRMARTLLDAPALNAAVERSADPAAARAFLARFLDDHPELADEVATTPLVRDALVALSAASRSLSSAVMRDPSLLDPVRDGESFGRERKLSEYRDSAAAFLADFDDGPGALRRWKRRELLRTAARDLLGAADLPAVGRELAALAEVCLGCALDLVAPGVPLGIIAMGKLGGRELNYASDVDVLFVHDDDGALAERAARAVLTTMSEPTADGIVFRTDADLRPEGRSGPLSRTLDAYAAYYGRWAQPWEFQALLKARPVAGDDGIGRRFLELVQPFVWPEVLDP